MATHFCEASGRLLGWPDTLYGYPCRLVLHIGGQDVDVTQVLRFDKAGRLIVDPERLVRFLPESNTRGHNESLRDTGAITRYLSARENCLCN
jgi:hypothetical protein